MKKIDWHAGFVSKPRKLMKQLEERDKHKILKISKGIYEISKGLPFKTQIVRIMVSYIVDLGTLALILWMWIKRSGILTGIRQKNP